MPYIVTVAPGANGGGLHMNSHPGEEFDRVLEGSIEMVIDGHSIILNEGDSVYFDATKLHGIRSASGKPARFLAVITSE